MYGVILAGGNGTRFWPLSREEYPKQVLKIVGNQSLIQNTVSRIQAFIPIAHIFIVTNPKQAEQMQFQFAPRSLPSFIYEPMGRNTAAAIGLAATVLKKRLGDGIMAIFSADHDIKNNEALQSAVGLAKDLANENYLVIVGARPTRPDTAFGYIQVGPSLQAFPNAHSVKKFIEKPEKDAAQAYIHAGNAFWNTGIFIWKVSTILAAIERYLPDLSCGLAQIEAGMGTAREATLTQEVYSRLASISIDYGLLEKTDHLAMIPVDMGWEDVGSWSALDKVLSKDTDGNIVIGNVVNRGSRNSIVYGDKRLIAVVGLQEVIVADTPDATLICAKDCAQEVKPLVETLQKRDIGKGEEHRIHKAVTRAWGSYTVLEEGKDSKIKRIFVNPKSRLSLQMHTRRAEHWVVVTGAARVTIGESVYTLSANQSTFVPVGVKHRLENPTDYPLEIIEVQSGDYIEEDDIVRYEDDYGRVKKVEGGSV